MHAAVFDERFFEAGFFDAGKDRAWRRRREERFEVVGRDDVEAFATFRRDETSALPRKWTGGKFGVCPQASLDGVDRRKRENRAAGRLFANPSSDAGDTIWEPVVNWTK